MGIFSFLSGKKKRKDANTNSKSKTYTSDNYLQESGVGGQIGNEAVESLRLDKDKYQNNLIAGDNRNEYQMRMQALKTGQTFDPSKFTFTDRKGNQISAGSDNKTIGNAGSAEAYNERFPITSGIQNLAGAASNLIPGVGMAKSILGVLNKMGGGAQTGLNKVKEGITNSDAYNDFIKMITIDEKPATDMGTRMSSMDQADADAASLNMADISGPSVATNIVDIKNNKVNTMPKNINAQSSLNDYFNTTGTINQIADSAGGVNTLPYNFTNTFNNLNPNALTSSQYLQGQNMINNLPENNTPIIPYSNVGINNPALFNKGSF